MSAVRQQGPAFILRLRSLRGDDIHKLRRLLKVLVRSHGWCCVSVEQERKTHEGKRALAEQTSQTCF
jgi:hypothetical protein